MFIRIVIKKTKKKFATLEITYPQNTSFSSHPFRNCCAPWNEQSIFYGQIQPPPQIKTKLKSPITSELTPFPLLRQLSL